MAKIWIVIKSFFINYGMIITIVTVLGYLIAPRAYEGVDGYFDARDENLLVRVDSMLTDQNKFVSNKIDSLISSQNVTTIQIDSLKYDRLLDDFREIQGELIRDLPARIQDQINDEITRLTSLRIRVVDRFGQFLNYEYYIVVPPKKKGDAVRFIKIESMDGLK